MTLCEVVGYRRRSISIALLILWMVPWCVGCSTHAKRVAIPRNLFFEGQLQPCREQLEKLAKNNRRDHDVATLDLAIVDLLEGKPKQAEVRLKEVRDKFDYLEQDSIAEKAVSMWTDDQVRSYAGEDYEKILIRVYLALASLMQDGIDAESYTLQILDKHQSIMQRLGNGEEPNPTVALQAAPTPSTGLSRSMGNVPSEVRQASMIDAAPISATQTLRNKYLYQGLPLGFYLRGMLREQTLHDYDDAARCYAQASQLLPDCLPLRWDLQRAQSGTHSGAGNGVVYVFAMVGRGPYKVEVEERPTSDALLIADRIVSAVGPYKLPPTIAPIKVPEVVVPTSDVQTVGVSVNGQSIGPTASLADIEDLALSTFRAQRNTIVARAVARRVVKKATVVAAKDSIGRDSLTSLGMDIAGIAWEASEAADTRCWGLLPREIQVLRVEVPAGQQTISLSPLAGQRLVGPHRQVNVNVVDGRNTYVLCWFPDARSACQIMTSDGPKVGIDASK